MKVVTIIGARPQFIKAAVVSKAFLETEITEVIVNTDQHYDQNMSNIFFEEMMIPKPSYSLNVRSGSHGAQTGIMLQKIEEVLLIEDPDFVLVYGDTNSTLAGALAASKLKIRVVHIEAGLRSFNRDMPEEINRVLTDHISDLLFCPSNTAKLNLLNEGISKDKIVVLGDVMYDAVIQFLEIANSKSQICDKMKISDSGYILATIHRAENTDNLNRLQGIINALSIISKSTKVVLPIHPRTSKVLEKVRFDNENFPNMMIIKPVGYLDMLMLESKSKLIVTDSGGIQKEAYFHKKPCIILRDETEWTELVDSGVNVLTGSDESKIVLKVEEFLSRTNFDFGIDFYGNGSSAKAIVKEIESYL